MESWVCIQFKTTGNEYFGTRDDISWRDSRGDELRDLLVEIGLDVSSMNLHSGVGSMEIFFLVSDVSNTIKLIKKYLTDREWIQFCKIASWPDENKENVYVHYPVNAAFSVWTWI